MKAVLLIFFYSALVVMPIALLPLPMLTFAVTWLPLTLFLGPRATKAGGGIVLWLCLLCVTWLVLFTARTLWSFAAGQ